MLDARQLAAQRGDRLLFAGLGLRLRAGEALWLRGGNGSGKTTLLRILAGLHAPLEGQVLWQDTTLRRDARVVSYLGHRNGLKEELTPRENLRHGLASAAPEGGDQDIDVLLARVGIDDERADLPCRHLSQGQQRRVALARVLAEGRPLWLLDEPFVGLDDQASTDVMVILRTHLHNQGLLIITSHQPLAATELMAPLTELHLGQHLGRQREQGQ
ncbi:cytochrome c biogenesis heme-transporting ATPase CcmA [Denitratisoma sp. agr-D3]